MDETRKRYVLAGVLIGAVSIGLVVLARKTPREQWGATLQRVAKDALAVVRIRYGDSEPLVLVEQTLEKFEENGQETAVSRAFHEAVEKSHGAA
jgi:hypothetical protein